jgi:hypothetical protein
MLMRYTGSFSIASMELDTCALDWVRLRVEFHCLCTGHGITYLGT